MAGTSVAAVIALAFGSLSARAVDSTTVFNEVMYHPAAGADPEWIELRNEMAVNMDLSGWRITGGVNFTFPNGTVIAAGGYLVVASNPGALQASAGITGVLGPWTGSLDNSGETIRLRNRIDRVMDELSYNDGDAWPAGADGSGFSLSRRSGHLSGTQPEHWAASAFRDGTPGSDNSGPLLGPVQPVFGLANAWLYNDTSAGLAGGWAAMEYSAGTGGWLSGNGVLAFQNATLPAAVGTVLATPASHPTGTYYFQKQFTFSGTPSAVQLSLRTLTDDGAVIYLNGQEVARQRLAAGTVTATTPASSEVTDAAFEDIAIPTAALVNGTNTLSVEAHQAGIPLANSAGSGGLTLNALTLQEVGGAIFTTNYARQAGAVAFAKDVLGNGVYAPTHTIPNLNNGTYGNGSSWIGNTLNSFCGVSFGATAVNLGRVAWGRDNTGTYGDRTGGAYTLEYTAVANPSASTPATGNPETGWATIGTATYPSNGSPYSLRHAFSFTPVMATGIRLTVPGDGIGSGACVDELEAGPPVAPGPPPFKLMVTGGMLDGAGDMALTGTAFAKDVIAGYAAHTIPHLNDGVTGNNNSWIGASANSFCGVGFATSRSIGRVAFGRDNTGFYTDRTLGSFTVQYTTVPNPTGSTPDTSWTTIGSILIDGSIPSPSLRHVYEFAAVNATGIRIQTPDGACIDELELYAPVPPDVVWGAALDMREIIAPPSSVPLVISEIAGTSAATWRIELQNTGATPLALGGLVLTFSGAPAGGYTLPAQTLAPGARLVLDEATLGFRPLAGDRVFLLTSGLTALIDAAAVKATTRARDGLGRMLAPSADTFGGANTFSLQTDVVINEIMYHYPSNPTENPEEWIELHNRGAAAVDVSGWKVDRAFTFSPGTSIPAGDYLVVAKNAAALAAKWPEVASKIAGNFTGSLSNSGERIALLDANGNPADEVRYATGGAWPSLPDGGGSSLELRDPRADNSVGGAWAASDQAGGTSWQNVSYTVTAGQMFGQTSWREFRIGMLDAGECLIDDISVMRVSNSQQLAQGGDFELLAIKWRMLGNHGTSAIETEPGAPSNHVLHVRATGTFGFNHNHIESTFADNTALVDGESYTVSFRARWLAGSNLLNTRAYYARLAKTTALALPARIGTPGAANSRAIANLGPTMTAFAHAPVVPAATEPVTVSVVATDPDNVASVTLLYALNGSASFTSVAMSAQGGGLYTGTVPAQSTGTIVQFYVAAQDALGAIAQMPAAGANSRALYIINDGQGSALSAHELRAIMLPADTTNLLAPLSRLSDARIGGTAIYRRSEVFYDIGVRLQGTAAGRIRDGEDYVGYDVAFPADHLFRGVHDSVNLDRSGRGPVVRGQDEIYVKHMFNAAGVPCAYDDLCYFIAPQMIHTGTAILQMAGYENTFVDSQYGGDGAVFSLDGTYEPLTTTDGDPESPKNPVPLDTQIQTDFADLGPDKEQYRGPLEIRASRSSDDYAGLIAFCQTMSLPNAQLAAQIGAKMDVDEWMRCAALYSLCGINDCYLNGGFTHNLRVHVPSDGASVSALPWDMDFVFSFAPTSPALLAGGNVRRVIDNSASARRLYYGHLQDLCNTVFNSATMSPWLTHYGSVVGQNMSAQTGYIDARRASVLSQLPASVAFAITTNGGAPFSVNATTATLAGTGWIDIREFRRADTGAVLDATWTSDTTWQLTVALNYGANPITLQAYNFQGTLIGSQSITITSTLNVGSVRDALRITEVHYNPAPPTTPAELAASSDKDDFEFIEVRNLSETYQIDTTGCKFIAGVDVTLGAILDELETAVIVRNAAAFQARYGTGPRIIGTYGPADSLSNGGETITLVDATGAIIQSFTYSDSWYPLTDGGGHSLISIAPALALDRDLATSWRASVAIGGNPNDSDAAAFSGNPIADADADGLNAFLEHALGSSDTSANTSGLALIPESGGTFALTFPSRLNADDVVLSIEISTALPVFQPASATRIASTQTGAILTQTWRLTPPVGTEKWFVRLKATAR